MVFVYFGPTADSWAIGNDHFSLSNNLPKAVQQIWDQLGNACADRIMAGTLISWISTSPEGSYAIMTKGGELLSNRQDLLAATYAQASSSIEHVALAPQGGWFIRFTDGSIQLSSPSSLPAAFHDIARNFIDTSITSRQHNSRLVRVFFGPSGAVMISTDQGVLSMGLSESASASIRSFAYGDMRSAGFFMGNGTALCPWSCDYYVLEVQSVFGAPRYEYRLPPCQLSDRLVSSILSNTKPASDTIPMPAPRYFPPPPSQSLSSPSPQAICEASYSSPSHHHVEHHPNLPPPAYQAEVPNRTWQASSPSTGFKTMELSTAMMCTGCGTGFVPGDIIYHCKLCREGKASFCESCHRNVSICQHGVERVRLERAKKLPIKDKNGSLGFGIKCDRCKIKIRKDSLLWYCRRCLDPYHCQDCWRRSDKRCKHAAKGKITLKLVDTDPEADEEWAILEEVVGIFI